MRDLGGTRKRRGKKKTSEGKTPKGKKGHSSSLTLSSMPGKKGNRTAEKRGRGGR